MAVAEHYNAHQIVDKKGEKYRAKYGTLYNSLGNWGKIR
jgi:hypothetical protein